MFQKAHFLFTLLCSGTTIAIIVLVSMFYLHVSENSLSENHFRSFQNDVSTIASSLEGTSSLSIQWLEKLEAQNDFIIYIIDNGTPFLYNSLRSINNHSSQSLLAESLDAYREIFPSAQTETVQNKTVQDEADNEIIYSIKMNNSSNQKYSVTVTAGYSYYGIGHHEYQFRSPSTGNSYYASIIDMEDNAALTQIVILSSLQSLNAQILRQRLRFLLIDLTAAAALLGFSYFFTGILLKPLRENQEAQLRFFAAASHELRTPLSVMLASAECCEAADAEEQSGFFRTIRTEGRRMNNLLSDMLTLAHTGANRFSIERAPAQLDTLCLNAYEAFESVCRSKNLSLSLRLPEDMPPRCLCDEERISQVLSILLHNAVSYTPEGGKIALSLECREGASSPFRSLNNNCFFIVVSDTGPGISDTDKKHVFERFYRTEKSRSAKEHFGLGLSIAYEIINAHHGKITVGDNPGGGSVFTVSLP